MLKSKPFAKLYKDDKDKFLQQLLYHLHRATEFAHKHEKEFYKEEKQNEKPKKMYSLDDPRVAVDPKL